MLSKMLKFSLLLPLLALILTPTLTLAQQPVPILIDDFESADNWWSYKAGSLFFNCEIVSDGYQSDHALEITFDVGKTGSPGCGFDNFESDPTWADTQGLTLMWKPSLSYMLVVVIIRMEDPTQTNPAADGLTDFEAYLLTESDTWSSVQLAWSDFGKSDWLADSGADTLDPSHIVTILFSVAEWERGSLTIDDLYLQPTLPAPEPETLPTAIP